MKRLLVALFGSFVLLLMAGYVPSVGVVGGTNIAQAAPPQADPGGGGNNAGDSCVTLGVKINSGDDKKVCGNEASGGIIYQYLRYIIIFLSGLVGLGVVLMLVWGGVQYIMSGGNPKSVADAKSRIMNALIGLVLFILMYGILNFVIPGGILG